MFIAPATKATTAAPAFSVSSDSLDAILALGQEEAKAAEIIEEAPVEDGFDFLTSLIDESLREKKEKARLAEARKLLKNTSIQGSRRARLEAEVTHLALQQEWIKTANVLWIRRCTCQMCEGVSDQFVGFFEQQRSRHSQVDRWIARDMPEDDDLALPRKTRLEYFVTEMCSDCLTSVGIVGGWNVPDVVEEDKILGERGPVVEEPMAKEETSEEEEGEGDEEEEEAFNFTTSLKEPQELEVEE